MRTAILLVAFAALSVVPSASAAETKPTKAQVRHQARILQTPRVAHCTSALRGLVYYRLRYSHWMTMRGQESVRAVRKPAGCAHARWKASAWRERAAAARVAYERWHQHHYSWREWLPSNWYALGSCETGYGGDPNWNHSNSSFTSAFGISWAEYDADAAHMGAPPWRVRHTPRDQWNAALGHLDRFGDGWTCPGP